MMCYESSQRCKFFCEPLIEINFEIKYIRIIKTELPLFCNLLVFLESNNEPPLEMAVVLLVTEQNNLV